MAVNDNEAETVGEIKISAESAILLLAVAGVMQNWFLNIAAGKGTKHFDLMLELRDAGALAFEPDGVGAFRGGLSDDLFSSIKEVSAAVTPYLPAGNLIETELDGASPALM